MKTRRGLYLRVAIVITIVIIAALVYTAYTSTRAQRRTVLTVIQRIEAQTIITREMLTTMEVPAPGPKDPFPYFTDPSQVIGRATKAALLPLSAITTDAVGNPAPPGRLLPSGRVIYPNYVAFDIPTTALRSVGGALSISDTVSILFPVLPTDPEARHEALDGTALLTYTIAYSNIAVVDLRDEAGVSLIAGEAQARATFIVLMLTPEQALEIAKYRDLLQLVLEGE